MKRLFNLLIIFIFVLFGINTVFAQTSQKSPEEIAREKGITFPIAELGNCQDFNSCRTFCEDPVNQNTCIDFAKKKGFYKEESDTRETQILNAARSELGCDSEESCRSLCSQEANHERCSNFAQKYNLGGGQVNDPAKAEILQKAKTILGCDSPSSCKALCEQEANREKCSEFARQTGLRGGEHQAGPGGCTSEETCKAFCSDPANFQICSRFQSSVSSNAKDFKGPGGCNSEETCRAYCEKNPKECGYGGAEQRNYDPSEMCSRTPNCSWTGITCECSSGITGDYNSNSDDYCKQYPERCQNFSPSPTYEDFSTQCTKYPGCAWNGSTCQCSGTTSQTSPTPNPNEPYSVQGGETIYQSECVNAGCSWTGSSCECSGTKEVQGAASEGLLQKFLRLLLTSK